MRTKKFDSFKDAEIARLDRPGIWMRAWEVRGVGSNSPAGIRRARALIRRWEKLTGRRYHGR